MNHYQGTKKVLSLVDELPSKEKPDIWRHAFDQIIGLSGKCDVIVVSPVYWPIRFRSLKKNRESLKKLPPYNYSIGTIHCWRPRYIDFTLFPWKYRKHYIQIFTMMLSLLFLVFRQRIRFDIIHAHFVYRPGYIAAILGKILGKPAIITAHGSDIHQNLYNEDRLFRKRTIDAMRWSNKIIAVSESLKKMIGKEGFGKKTCVIPCGFSEKEFYPMDKKECRVKLSLKTNDKILLFIGNLVTVKGVDVLIEAFKIFRNEGDNVQLIVIGDGPERRALERQVRDFSVNRMVYFLGRKDPTEIPLYINAADILVIPSRDEGRPVVIFEALACGRPVVASRVGGIPETIINDKLGILVEKENPAALADGIIKALTCSWDTKYLSNYAKKYSQEQLSPHVLSIYDEVLSRK